MKNEKIIFRLSILSAIYFLVYFILYFSGLQLPKIIQVLQELLTLGFLVLLAACFVAALVNFIKQGFRLRSLSFYALLLTAFVIGFLVGLTLIEERLVAF